MEPEPLGSTRSVARTQERHQHHQPCGNSWPGKTAAQSDLMPSLYPVLLSSVRRVSAVPCAWYQGHRTSLALKLSWHKKLSAAILSKPWPKTTGCRLRKEPPIHRVTDLNWGLAGSGLENSFYAGQRLKSCAPRWGSENFAACYVLDSAQM